MMKSPWIASVVVLVGMGSGCTTLKTSEELESARLGSVETSHGAPVPAEVVQAVTDFDSETEILLSDLRKGVQFDGSPAILSINSKARLNKLVEKVEVYGLGPIEIVVPADRLEQKIARAKAMTVQNFLESQGVDPLDIDVYTEGSPEISVADDISVQVSIKP